MSYQVLAAKQSPRFNLVVIDGSYQGLWITRRGFFVCFVFKDGFRRNLLGTQHIQVPNPCNTLPKKLSLIKLFNSEQNFHWYHLYCVYFMHFPLSSHSPLVIWPHSNESKKIKGPDYIQSSCHGLWEGRIANTSVQMVQSLLPPSLRPCSRPTCPHFPSLRDSHRRPLALGSEELNRCIYSSSQTPPSFTSELTLSMQITLIQNSQDRKSGVFPVLWEIFSFREGAAGGSLHSSLQLAAGHSGSSQRKLSSEAQLDIHWFLNLNLSSNCPSKPKDWGLSK